MSNPDVEPAQPFKPRHTNAQRAVLAVNIIVVIACLVGAGALIYGKNQLDGRLQTSLIEVNTTTVAGQPTGTSVAVGPGDTIASGEPASTAVPETFPAADPGAQNFLIVGSDANACVDANSQWAGAADPGRENIGNRSDTIMIMRVDPVTRQAAVLSFPRDLWVKIPGRAKSRINSAYIRNDPTLLTQTLYDNFGINVDHYIQVDFCAFKRIVDAVGGVTVPFSTRILDKNVGLDVASGCHTFSGDEALAYVRSRHLKWMDENGKTHEDGTSDLGRISRQQDFLRRTLRSALNKGIFDPSVARALIVSLQKDIVTEAGFTINDMLQFAGVLRDVDPDSIRTYQIEGKGMMISGNSVLDPRIGGDNMKAILAIFRNEAPLAGAPEQSFETTTSTATTTTTTRATGTTVAGGTVSTTTTAATTSTVPEPEQNVKGEILPDPNLVCT
ncbi:MAG TPA: LCP family protein [Ilumatobacteraceae bacterium]|nr:LCP family protein [Ilumatobacteraceae bacterium]HRB03707.1 LCP family protein [Ilumatobacteraceae bacterium]